MRKFKLFFCSAILFASVNSFAQTTITAKEASKHIGEKVMVCDQVFGGKFLSEADITLIDLGGSHPNELLILVIKGDDRKKFKSPPEEDFNNKKVCVTGQIIEYKGKPEIIITDPEQIKEDK